MASSSPRITLQNHHHRRYLFAAIGLFLVLYLGWILLSPRDSESHFLVGNLAMIVSGTAVFLLVLEFRRQYTQAGGMDRKLIRVWSWLGLGLLLWTIGDIISLVLELTSPESPVNFIPLDLLLLAGSITMLVAVFLMPRNPRDHVGPVRLYLDVVITNAALMTLAWLIVFKPAFESALGGQANLAAALFPLVDLIMLLVLIYWFFVSQTGSLPSAFSWASGALTVYAVTDITYTYFTVHNLGSLVNLMDVGWMIGDGLMATAALVQFTASPASSHTAANGQLAHGRARLQSLLPLIVTILLGAYTIGTWQLGDHFDPFGLWLTVIFGSGLIARQGILAGELEFQQYASLVNSVAEPTFVCDKRGLLKLVNPALLTAAGYDHPNQMLHLPIFDLLDIPENNDELLTQALTGGWSGEVQLRRIDGSLIPVSLALRPIKRPRGDALALAGTAHDLSEHKRQQAAIQQAYEQIAKAHAELEQLNTQLEKKVMEKTASLCEAYMQLEERNYELQNLDRMKTDFVSLVSHELRAPLTNINGGIELVLSHSNPVPTRVVSTLTLVQAEIQRLTRFIETILDLSALDAGRTPIYPAPIHPKMIVQAVKNQILHLPGMSRITWRIPDNLPYFIADEQALISVLLHLFDNANKYAPEGNVFVSAGTEVDNVWIKVEDEGPGIPPKALPLMFTRFYRSQASDSQTTYGHGLGLYIARRLMRAMNGEIEVSNRAEKGACFTCWLPTVTEQDWDGSESDPV